MPANVENARPNEENGKFFQMEIYEFIIHLVPQSPNGSLSWGGEFFKLSLSDYQRMDSGQRCVIINTQFRVVFLSALNLYGLFSRPHRVFAATTQLQMCNNINE